MLWGYLAGGTGVSCLKNIRYYTYEEYTRVVLDLSSEISITEKVLPGTEGKPDRLYFDMEKCDFDPQYPADKRKHIKLEKGHLIGIRLAKKSRHCIRVVFDFDKIRKHTRFYLTSPFRVVFDVYREENGKKNDPLMVRTPAEKMDKNYSVIRQLGLGVRTIVIDPGHGGKDPGALNPKLGLREKDITLDIAKRLRTLFKKHSQYNVILTRETDRYLSLEERTAIANSRKGDLFISIHVNSAPRKSARGVETYYLGMTTDPWAEQVASVENMVGEKSIGDMKSLLEQILKTSKISESRVFTKLIQKTLVKQLRKKYKYIDSMGNRKAMFIVLVGARMPSVLVEVSYLSNQMEGKRLKSPAYRYSIAEGLYFSIISYIKSLGKK